MVSTNPKDWPHGRPLLPQKFIHDFKMERCARAIADLVHEVGPHAVTASMVTKRVKVAKATFYELFDGREAAFRYACENGRAALLEPVEAAAKEPGTWEGQLESTIGALLGAASEEPHLAELCLVHSTALLREQTGPYDSAFVKTLTRVLTDILPSIPEKSILDFNELSAYGIVSIVARRLIDGKAEALPGLQGELTTIVSAPYRTGEAARA
ncbi:MAG: hypothetical protein QOF06_1682 [Solirubrobacterales bacterium]|jgi:AcrR family transcriptional regulator|nr:hypothetical protein [Solirubrobacterales bacterium]